MAQDIHNVCDYIILKVSESGAGLNNLKLQKLVYYCQAWHLALHGKPLFQGRFQAWVHGPVSRELYDRFISDKSLYSQIDSADIRPSFDPNICLSVGEKSHVNLVLENYAGFSGTQLEEMTHEESPWLEARGSVHPAMRCENQLDEALMEQYYSNRLKQEE